MTGFVPKSKEKTRRCINFPACKGRMTRCWAYGSEEGMQFFWKCQRCGKERSL